MNYVSQENLDNIVKGLSNKIVMSVSNGALIGDTTPVGTVISFMGTQAPLFYLVCDGSTYNIEEYNELANFIEAQFGSKNFFGGDGIDTFAIPDLRGEFLRGTGTNSHENQGNGDNVGVHQDATEHIDLYISTYAKYIGAYASTNSATDYERSTNKDSTQNGVAYLQNNSFQSATGAYSNAGLFTSRPTNTSVLYCIKYTKAVIPSEYEDGTPVGRVIFDSILREGYIKANGAQIEDATIAIPRLLSFVQKYSSQILAPDQATYDANVGLYMYDSNNDILTLPNYIGRFMEGGNSVTSIEAGLPNITRNFITRGLKDTRIVVASDGVFNVTADNVYGDADVYSGSTKNGAVKIDFDASQANPIYSDSVNTVQPSSITLIPQIRY